MPGTPLQLLPQFLLLSIGQQSCKIVVTFEFIVPANDRRHNLTHETVQIGVSRAFDVKIATANIINSLFEIKQEGYRIYKIFI